MAIVNGIDIIVKYHANTVATHRKMTSESTFPASPTERAVDASDIKVAPIEMDNRKNQPIIARNILNLLI